MEGNQITPAENRKRKAVKAAKTLGIPTSTLSAKRLLEDEAVLSKDAKTSTVTKSPEASATTLTPEVDASVDNILQEKRKRDEAMVEIASALRVAVDSPELQAMTRNRSTKDLEAIALNLNSPELADKKRGLAELGSGDPEYIKRLEEDAEKQKSLLNVVTTGAILMVAAGAATSTTAVPAAAAAAARLPATETSMGELASVPGAKEIIDAAPTIEDFGLTMYGRSFNGVGNLKAQQSATAPVSKPDSVAKTVLKPAASPLAALSVVAPD